MLECGYLKVGSDFPVFLHPDSKDEYALARRERKVGNGYSGFVCDIDNVTIQEDLARRDLTINAIAQHTITDELIDIFSGIDDIENKILRAVDLHAFTEDPVRVLRLARFAARYGAEWRIDTDTLNAAKQVVQSDDWLALTPNRVWLELEKALSEPNAHIFFEVMADLAESHWFAEVIAMLHIPQPIEWHPEGDVFVHTMQALSAAVYDGAPLTVRFAALCHDFGKPVTYHARGNLYGHEEAGVAPIDDFCDRLKVPSKYRQLAILTAKYHLKIHRIMTLKPKTIVNMFTAIGAYRNADILTELLAACSCDSRARNNLHDSYEQADIAQRLLSASTDVKMFTRVLIARGVTGAELGAQIHARRVNDVTAAKRSIERK
jgi:tRNA nucleotidyltransferase (CCA-adding enzyme)